MQLVIATTFQAKGKPKRYMIFAGDSYYPAGGWEDFIGSTDTLNDAAAVTLNYENPIYRSKYDWYQIIDSETGEEVQPTAVSPA